MFYQLFPVDGLGKRVCRGAPVRIQHGGATGRSTAESFMRWKTGIFWLELSFNKNDRTA